MGHSTESIPPSRGPVYQTYCWRLCSSSVRRLLTTHSSVRGLGKTIAKPFDPRSLFVSRRMSQRHAWLVPLSNILYTYRGVRCALICCALPLQLSSIISLFGAAVWIHIYGPLLLNDDGCRECRARRSAYGLPVWTWKLSCTQIISIPFILPDYLRCKRLRQSGL